MAYSMEAEVWFEGWGDESLSSSSEYYYDVIRKSLLPEYRDLSDDEIDELVAQVLENMAPEEVESFWGTVKNVVKGVGQVATKALPIAAPIIGTAIGGPIGGAIGGKLGKVAGQSLGGVLRPQRPPTPPPVLGAVPTAAQAPIPAGGSSATAQLMSLLQNPALLQSILGQIMGRAGQSSVQVGEQHRPAPFGAFMNALSELANHAATEANARFPGEGVQETSRYLLDAEGNFLCDPANPAERAQVLLERLREDLFTKADYDEDGEDLGEWFMKAGLIESYFSPRQR